MTLVNCMACLAVEGNLLISPSKMRKLIEEDGTVHHATRDVTEDYEMPRYNKLCDLHAYR